MQLLGKLVIKSKDKIIQFLNEEHTGRISSIDNNGYPQIIPMNFVFISNSIYMHSHIKGEASVISKPREKILALNGLMKKYQPEGKYEPMNEKMDVLEAVSVIKIIPKEMNGKYKIGQNMSKDEKIELAQKIKNRNSQTSRDTLEVMGFSIESGKLVMKEDVEW